MTIECYQFIYLFLFRHQYIPKVGTHVFPLQHLLMIYFHPMPHSFACIAQSNGDIRLVGSDHEGRLEIYLDSEWGTVCNDFFGQDEADVVCHQLGYEDADDYGSATSLG